MNSPLWSKLTKPPDPVRALNNYRHLAAGYDGTCTRITALRQRAVLALQLKPGETVFDIACGTGSTLIDLAAAVGAEGHVAGVELSPEMAALASKRVTAAGLAGRVKVIVCAVESMPLDRKADALLFCYTHDVLQSPAAMNRVLELAKPGARIVILGMKALPWLWGWPVNVFNMVRARRYMTTYRNLRKPWRLLEEHDASLCVVHSALWGSAYIAVGTAAITAPMVASRSPHGDVLLRKAYP
jgi:ubiquinone/menaquinone biosynthesis C-methylase UbiE